MVALKEMEGDRAIQGMLNHYSIKEIMTLRKLSHPNIASADSVHFNHNLYDFQKFDPNKKHFKMYIQMEKARQDLMDLTINKETPHRLEASEIKCILKLIANGLLYLHQEKNIVHRDIKPPNILLYERNGKHGDGIVKITDFNHAIELEKLK